MDLCSLPTFGLIAIMKTRVVLDEEGYITIPESVRDELGLAPGGALAIISDGEEIVLRPVPETPTL
jgi:AbrB family looped-hinge helix DNA binding protein